MMDAPTPAEDQPYLRIDYVARTGNDRIIDTSDPDVAAESDLAELEASGPIVVVPGEGHLFEPVEAALSDAEVGTTIEVTVAPEDAFGTPVPDEMVTLDRDAVAPDHREPGTTVQLGGRRAVVEDVSDETVTVDFNHPLAGVTLEYEIEILDRLEGTETRAAGLVTTHGLRGTAVDYDRDSEALTLRYSAPEPTADHDARKRAYIEDVRRLLDVASVTVIEEFGSDGD